MTARLGVEEESDALEAALETAPAEGPSDLGKRFLHIAALLIPVVVIVIAGWQRRWTTEDAFLNFRIVDQIRAGHGPVFNPGQRIEAGTSTLWLWMLVVLRSVLPFVKIEYLAMTAGLTLTAAGVWWAERGAARLWANDAAAVLVPFGALVYVATPASWDWATSGLENGLSIAWLGALMYVLGWLATTKLPQRRRNLALVGVLVGLGPLIRPDLAIMTVTVTIAIVLIGRLRGRALATFAVALVALPVAYEVFRVAYYATLVPNTALAKAASSAYWHQGWKYLLDFARPYWLIVPVVVVVVTGVLLARHASKARVIAALALPIGGAIHALYITRSGGDYIHARLLIPSFFALLAPVAAIAWRRWLLAPLGAVVIWAVASAGFLRPVTHVLYVPLTHYGMEDARGLAIQYSKPGGGPLLAVDSRQQDGPLARRLQAEGRRDLVTFAAPKPLRNATPERTTLVSPTAGVSGYLAGPDVIVYEVNALADAVGSRMPALPLAPAGHRKREPDPWIVALTTRPGVNVGQPADQVDAARRALTCGDLAGLQRAVNGPLTFQRMVSNALGSWTRTRLEVPRQPERAEQKFCRTDASRPASP